MNKIIDKSPFLLALLLLFAFDFSLTLFRNFYTDGSRFTFLVWNLFLAFLPFVFIQLALKSKKEGLSTIVVGGFGLISLLFLPNAPYIMTDLFHLAYKKPNLPLWFDTLLIFSYAITGIVLFYATLLEMERLLYSYWRKSVIQVALLGVLFLNAFGIYLGRYMRFNSWDILSNPLGLLEEILKRFTNPFGHAGTWGLTLCYGLLFLVGFCCIKLVQRGIKLNYQPK